MEQKNQLLTPFSQSPDALMQELKTTQSGLSHDDAKKRLQEYGLNQLTQKKKVSPLTIFIDQFKNTLTLILLGSVGLVLFIYFFGEHEQSDLIEAALILAIVLMIAVLGFIQEFKAEKALESLKKMLAFKAKVRRDGNEEEIDVTELVPGDIVILEEGEKVPADIRLWQVFSLSVNESSLTGESTTVSKKIDVLPENTQLGDQKNMVFAGTNVTAGRGFGVVVRTGDHTEIGKIATMVAEQEDEETPIQKRLDAIGKMIGYLVLGISAIVFVFIMFFADDYSSLPLLQKVIHSFIAAVALAVAAIPEGLPAVVTISLAIGTQRMVKKNALVRKLSSVESLGSVDVICSDKTGTLTKNEMTVKALYFDNQAYEVQGIGYEVKGEFTKDNSTVDPKTFALLLHAGLYCNNAKVTDGKILGDPTEAALLVSAGKAGIKEEGKRLLEVPFSSERKMMSVVVENQNERWLYAKGAPEMIIGKCTKIYKNGNEESISEDDRKQILEQVTAMSSKALRVLGFGYKKISTDDERINTDKGEELEHDLVFVGLQGMIDPAREEVKPLIEQCTKSGIRVVMITGDHELTAKAVANEIGITGDSLTGEALDKLSEQELVTMVEKVSIYARVNPGSKMKIVQALQHNGHIVAMTGDGVNDAPALKKADIGISMGITGTDVAKEASDMVLLDDKFSTIVSAIEEGRGIYQNIRKFVQYLLSCNIGEVMVVFAGVMIFKDLPLTATMLLWINVVTDGLPAVALGLDRPEKGIMAMSPRKFQSEIITKKLWAEMFIFGVILTIAVLGLYYYNLSTDHIAEAKAGAFIAIAFFEFVYLFIIRASYGTPFFSNKWLWWAIFVTILMQVTIVFVPFLAAIFEVSHIDPIDWLYIAVGTVIMAGLFKVFKRTMAV